MAEVIVLNELEQANKKFMVGDYIQALAQASSLVEKEASLEGSLRLKAACEFKLNQIDAAEQTLKRLIVINDKFADDYSNLAHIYLKKQQYAQAEKMALRAMELGANNESLSLQLMSIYANLNRMGEALAFAEKKLKENPQQSQLQYQLALLTKNKTEIVAALKKMSAEQPLNVEPKLLLAQHYLDQADFTNAVYYFNESLAVNPNESMVSYLSGVLSYRNNQFKVADGHFLRALQLVPDVPEIHLGLAKSYLIQDQLDSGWKALDWHRKAHTLPLVEKLMQEYVLWQGLPLTKKHLLIYIPFLPDVKTTLFYRYLKAIKTNKMTLTVLASADQAELLKTLNLADKVITENETLPADIDFFASLFSLPAINAFDYELASLAKLALNESTGKLPAKVEKIGLCWQQDQMAVYKELNTLNFAEFDSLLSTIKAEFHCLCPDKLNIEELAWCKKNNIVIHPHLNQPQSLIEVLTSLDLVISTDNELAHLSATLNKPTWVLAPFYATWYLGKEGRQTPWYPAMQIFRQQKLNRWDNLITQVINQLMQNAAYQKQPTANKELKLINTITEIQARKEYKLSFELSKNGIKEYPNQAFFWFAMGIASAGLKDNKMALACLLQAGKLNENVDICTNLGTTYYRLSEIEKALYYFKRAVELAPTNGTAVKNLAITYFELGQQQEGIEVYRQALKLADNDENHFGYSLQLLNLGLYEEGWREYEYRLKIPQHNYNSLKVNTSLWDGSNLNNKTILIVSEQGLGDNLQFIRFLKLLKQQYSCKVIFACSKNLVRLMKQYTEIDQIISENETIPKHDYHLPIMSLAMHFKIYDPSLFMKDTPYIIAHPVLQNYWSQYFRKNKLKIGFCWSGNPSHINNERRNCSLFDFIKLKDNKNIELYSLQKNMTPEEKELLQAANIDDLGEKFDDLADTAAAISQLDLVISIDSALAHLAGAMGKETWLILPPYAEWRHPVDTDYSPWYKQVKFYRPVLFGDWRAVFENIDRDLQQRSTQKV